MERLWRVVLLLSSMVIGLALLVGPHAVADARDAPAAGAPALTRSDDDLTVYILGRGRAVWPWELVPQVKNESRTTHAWVRFQARMSQRVQLVGCGIHRIGVWGDWTPVRAWAYYPNGEMEVQVNNVRIPPNALLQCVMTTTSFTTVQASAWDTTAVPYYYYETMPHIVGIPPGVQSVEGGR